MNLSMYRAIKKTERDRRNNAACRPLSDRTLKLADAIATCDDILDDIDGVDYDDIDGEATA